MYHNKSISLSLCLFLTVLVFFTGCQKEIPEEVDENTIQLEVTECFEPVKYYGDKSWKIDYWRRTNKRICIIFGYDFNSPEIIEEYTNLLQNKFGLEADGGPIFSVIYPTSFKHNGKSYISDLTSMLTEMDKNLSGIIILGAPENTHIALGRVQDYWKMKIPYPIFSLFPQDDFLGMESTCDFVLDKSQSAEISGNIIPEDDVSKKIEEAPEVLVSAVNYMLMMDGPFLKDNSIQKHALQMLKGRKLQYYLDPETGIHAINHFILY